VEPQQVPQAAPQTEDWSKRFNGLQQAITKRLQATGWGNLDAIPAKADVDQMVARAGQLAELQVQFEQTSLQAQTLVSEKEQLAQQLAAVESGHRKLNLILQNAPTLAAFADYIPTRATPEEQLSEIETFRTRLGSMAPTSPARLNVPSSTPPIAGPSQAPAELFAQMNAAAQAKNWPEYERPDLCATPLPHLNSP
jgi:chaperonin cofactor prefoldin